ncbi:hypothetical protein WICPIJ_000733 [Wickerhamomyces pijperi]|uniref:Uncharacterized protein n=1 Tax=Wickerhamomyces pijperi TaxID=599730 RepID=A0A9P8QC10_WICPI|nr:hypothetical protein WICPIJ_000733 [Wickerhamomyces pijperi]
MTIATVELTTAGQPPPKTRSKTIGRVSLVITLDNNKVTKTQCLPRSNNFKTFSAFCLSEGSPEVDMTFK